MAVPLTVPVMWPPVRHGVPVIAMVPASFDPCWVQSIWKLPDAASPEVFVHVPFHVPASALAVEPPPPSGTGGPTDALPVAESWGPAPPALLLLLLLQAANSTTHAASDPIHLVFAMAFSLRSWLPLPHETVIFFPTDQRQWSPDD
jgi:hypothetical protein